MVVLTVAILIAAAISDSLNDIRTLVTVIGAAYIVSGIAKAGTGHSVSRGRGRSRT